MKKLYVFFMMLVLMAYCCERTDVCEDYTSHDFTSVELDWFSYGLNDTLYFLNLTKGDTNYITCHSEEFRDTIRFQEDIYCEGGGYTSTWKKMVNEFHTDFPHFDTYDYMDIHMETTTRGEQFLEIEIEPHSGNHGNLYAMKFDNVNQSLINSIDGYANPISVGTISIQGKSYENVFAIPISDRPEYLELVCYDSIYYNQDGFLKFISSQYGYRLERLP